MTDKTDPANAPVHPFRQFWESGDLDPWMDTMAPDVELQSPMLSTPFRGRQTAAELYGVLFDRLKEFEVAEEFSSEDSYVCRWRALVGGRQIEGADFIRTNEDGLITDVRVLIRPLTSIAAFASGIGPQLAARRGPIRSALVRFFNLPFRAMATALDLIAPRLVLRRRSS